MTISHRQAKLYIDMALDGTLSEAMQVRLDEHLAGCTGCRIYAQEWMLFDDALTHSLAGLGASPPVPPQQIARTLTAVATRRQQWRFWQPFQASGRVMVNGLVLVAFIVAVFWFLRPPETAVDSPTPSATVEPDIEADTIASLTSDYVVVHFDFGGSDGLELVHPACDGMASLPQPDTLAQVAASGETPYCELITSNTLLFKPGESRQALLIYRSSIENEVELSFTPQTVTDLNRPFVQGICRQDVVTTGESCYRTTVGGGSVWASYIDLTAPETAVLGTSIVVSINVRAQELAIKP
ncbi:MAG: zf-HC2 domain-containing protein [Ardenticatenaceae bacterium]|nr:zf-HC2 domain-containing protein [Ardenticatenaceae bacterium]MCB9443188.1 zf-HC2 domain-containing protein [Ardenticatenaceae bacterium]